MRGLRGWCLLAEDSQGALAVGPSPPPRHLPRGSCSFQMRPGLSCDLDPDKVSGVWSVVGNSPASAEKWVCPRFQFIIRDRRMQRWRSRRGRHRPPRRFPTMLRKGAAGARWLPRCLRPRAPGSRPRLSLGGCPFCRWARGICHTHRDMCPQPFSAAC